MKKAILLCGLFLLGSAPPEAAAGPEDSVVKVFTTPPQRPEPAAATPAR